MIEPTGLPLQQLYKICINHLVDRGYKFKLTFEHDTQVLIELENGQAIDFFKKPNSDKGE